MTITAQKLYELLPAIYRIRDAEQGEPLKALLSVMASQIDVVEEDIDRLYENWFIETCEEWLVPYIGDLLGVRPLEGAGDDVFSLRAYVANTLAYRRRKGTVAVLEELAHDVTGRPAKAVEFFNLLTASRHLNHVRPGQSGAVRIGGRGARNALELLGGPFEKTGHTAEVRRIVKNRGKYNIPNVGLYLWRLTPYTVWRGQARTAADAPAGCFRFSPLGYDAPLFNPPQTEDGIAHLAEEINVPGILRRLPLYLELEARRKAVAQKKDPVALYFGATPVFQIFLNDAETALAPDEIVIANLEGWDAPGWKPPQSVTYAKNKKTQCAVDPALGRLAFLDGVAVKSVAVTYTYGFSGATGGGPYDRRKSLDTWYHPGKLPATWHRTVTGSQSGHTLKDALDAWNAYSRKHPRVFGLITIADSRTYADTLPEIEIPYGSRLAIVAADCPAKFISKSGIPSVLSVDNLRPHILGDLVVTASPGASILRGTERGEFLVDGLLVEGSLEVKACNLGVLHLAHSTLASSQNGQKPSRTKPGLSIASGNTGLQVTLDHCITETVCSAADIDLLSIADSILDAGGADRIVVVEPSGSQYGPVTQIERSTLLGKSFFKELYASETIFTGEVNVERCQTGCMRFSYLALPSDPAVTPKTPPRYRCQPCLEIATQDEQFQAEGRSVDPVLIRKNVSLWLRPGFTSTRYGQPAYGQLSLSTPLQIRTGAEDASEMGAFCRLKQPQRENNLRAALDEYLRSGLQAGIFYVPYENITRGGST